MSALEWVEVESGALTARLGGGYVAHVLPPRLLESSWRGQVTYAGFAWQDERKFASKRAAQSFFEKNKDVWR